MAKADTPSVGSIENIISPNENFTEEDEAALNAGENMVRKQSLSINKDEVVSQSKMLKERENSVNILVLGLTGAGKSTLVNAMMGDILAQSQAGAKACSSGIVCHEGEHEDIRIKIYDTAGFGESDIQEKNILQNIAENTPRKGYDLILIAIRMDSRLDTDNAKKMLSSLGRDMEPEMWKRLIVVLTFANFFVFQLENGYQDFTEEAIKLQVERETEEFRRVFKEHTGKDYRLASQIPFILAGSMKQRKLPIDDDWLVTLWDHSILRCRTKVKPFLKRIRLQRLFVDLRLMIQNIFPFKGNSERDSTERHDKRPIQSSAELSVGANSEKHNGQGVPGQQEGQIQNVPLADDYNGFKKEEEEMSEPRDGVIDLQEDGLERMEDFDLLSEITSAMPKLSD
uniref:AIG1-type G domain-containing protein n=1 Tax=Amphimedon queenslandica TaxID=400682 RepID=A0A1X7VMN7_AMPQE